MSTPLQKPMGPYCGIYVKAESTPFTAEEWAATDALRSTESTMGDAARSREEIDETRCNRGSHAEVLGRLPDVEWSITERMTGSGTAGTAVPARTALFKDAAGLSSTNVPATSQTYESDSANPTSTVTIYRVDRDGIFAEYLIGAICQQIVYTWNNTDAPTIQYSGVAARKWEFMKTTLADVGGIADIDTTMTLTDVKHIRTGTEATSDSNLMIFVKIDSEIVKITAYNWSTGVATIARAQFGTAAAAHSQNADITPYAEAPTYATNSGIPVSPNDWTVADGVGTIDATELSYTLETGRAFDPLESGNIASTALYNGKIMGTGSVSYIFSTERYYLQRDLDAGTEADMAIVGGSTAGSIFTVNLDKVRWLNTVPKDLANNETTIISQEFRTRDNIDTLLGQLQHVET